MLALQQTLIANGLEKTCTDLQLYYNRHKQYPNLVLFHYDIGADFGNPAVCQARGIILDEDDGWKVISRSYDKFFNQGEGHAAKIDWNTARVYEKYDGSIITLYWYRGWQVATSGTPDANCPINNTDKTFASLFWETLSKYVDYKVFNPDFCYIFELMTPYNKVVVQHESSSLVLHGIRNYCTYTEYHPEDLQSSLFAADIAKFPQIKNLPIARSYPLSSLADCLAAANVLNPVEHEGYVVCDANFSRIKIKSPKYVALHHLKSDLSPKNIVNLIQLNETPELLSYFPELQDLFTQWQVNYDKLCKYIDIALLAAKADLQSNYDNRKDFALWVKRFYPSVSSALFALHHKGVANAKAYLTQARVETIIAWITELL